MSDVTLVETHVVDAQALLTMRFQKPVIQAVLAAYAKQVQEVENALYDVWFFHILANSVGDQLDQWGALVDSPRADRTDDQYRVVIKIRFRAMRSKGKVLDIIEITALALSLSTGEQHYDEPIRPGGTGPNARFAVTVSNVDDFVVDALAQGLHDGKAVATVGQLIYTLWPDADQAKYNDTTGSIDDNTWADSGATITSLFAGVKEI
jgi:hypothetical protein